MWFPSYGFVTIKESVRSLQLEFPCRHCRRQTSWTVFSSTTSDWGCLSWRPTKRPSRAAWRCRSADEDLRVFMVHFLFTFQEFVRNVFPNGMRDQQHVLPNPPDLNPLYFYLRRHLKSTIYAKEVSDIQVLHQRSRPDLRWLVRHQEFFSESGDLGSDMRDSALMLELDTEHFLYSSGARNSETLLQKPSIHKAFFWCCL